MGIYTYTAFDFTKNYSASVQFTISEPPPTGTPTLTATPTPTPTDTPTATPTPTSTPTSFISGSVWNDDDGNGVRDEIEDGIAGVTVDLYFDNDGAGTLNPDDTWVDTQTSAEDGSYRFSDLSAGDYIVQVTDTDGVLSDYALTTDNNLLPVHLWEGEAYSEADFGYEAVAYPA